MKPLVSIITATYNLIENGRAEYIKQAIDSVCSQTYKNIEHIIVDGASTDGTVELIKDLQKGRENLYLYSEKDKGIYDAFNNGVKYAKGKYIIFLNSDDLYHSNMGIEKCVNLLEKDNLDFCFSESNIVNNDVVCKFIPKIECFFKGISFIHISLICKRDILLKYPFDIKYKFLADLDFIFKLILNKYKYKELNYNFTFFRAGGYSQLPDNQLNLIKEIKDIFKLNCKGISDFTDYYIEKMAEPNFDGAFSDKLEKTLSKYFKDKKLYWHWNNEIKSILQKKIPDNDFVNDIREKCNDENREKIENYLQNNIPLLSSADYFLYQKLLKKDKKLFVDFVLKRWAGIDTCSKTERTKLNKLYQNAYKIFNQRKSIDEPIDCVLNNKKVCIISQVPVVNCKITPENEVGGYYEYVHCFELKEYIMDDFFNIEEGSYILDCGSTIGGSTILLKSYYPKNPIISIESDTNIYNLFKKNIELNKYSDVTPVNAFISYTDSVSSLTIDTITKDLDKVGLIKLNINGNERFALDGAYETITKHKPNLIIALHNVQDDIMYIPYKLSKYNMPMKFRLKWIEKRVYGIDCLLFVKFL